MNQFVSQVWLSEEAELYNLHVRQSGKVRLLRVSQHPACLSGRIFTGSSAQVVAFGRLGVLGRNGWYCREADVEKWNAVAGCAG